MADDMMQMQREAARRVNRMQEHSRRVFEQHRGEFSAPARGTQSPGFSQPTIRAGGFYAQPAPTSPPPCKAESTEALTTAPLSGEQWLLLGVALLLFRCGNNPLLSLALVYLAL